MSECSPLLQHSRGPPTFNCCTRFFFRQTQHKCIPPLLVFRQWWWGAFSKPPCRTPHKKCRNHKHARPGKTLLIRCHVTVGSSPGKKGMKAWRGSLDIKLAGDKLSPCTPGVNHDHELPEENAVAALKHLALPSRGSQDRGSQ